MGIRQKNTPVANRYGLNLQICDANDSSIVYQTIDFANMTQIELSGDTAFATGGQAHTQKVGFYDKIVGTLTLRTQILTQNLLLLMTGKGDTVWDGHSPIIFHNNIFDQSRVFTIIGDTIWKDKNGVSYDERVTFHRVRPNIAYKKSFAKTGDIAEVYIVFDLLQDDDGQVVTFGPGGEVPKWSTPTISIDDSVLSITHVPDVTKYKIYADMTYIGYVDENNVWHAL